MSECEKCSREKAERQRKRGAYWTSPEGRAEIRDVWSNPNDGNCVLPLLDALERAEVALREVVARVVDVLPPVCEFDGCCSDDACRLGMDVRAALSGPGGAP